MRRLAAFREYLKERLEDARPTEAPEPLPYAVPVAKLVGQGSPGDTVDRETLWEDRVVLDEVFWKALWLAWRCHQQIVDCLQEFSVIMSRFSPVRLHCVEHFKCDQPISLRHSCKHVRPPDAGHAVIRTNSDSGIRQKCMPGIPSTQPRTTFYS